jgi:hypothetical protein
MEQDREHSALLGRAEWDRSSVVDQFSRTEDAEFHVRPHQRVIRPLLIVFEEGNFSPTLTELRDIRHAIASSRASLRQGFRKVARNAPPAW